MTTVIRTLSAGSITYNYNLQLFLEVIYKPRDWALSVPIAARLRLASICTDKALSLGL
jgi:hypothetical protein